MTSTAQSSATLNYQNYLPTKHTNCSYSVYSQKLKWEKIEFWIDNCGNH